MDFNSRSWPNLNAVGVDKVVRLPNASEQRLPIVQVRGLLRKIEHAVEVGSLAGVSATIGGVLTSVALYKGRDIGLAYTGIAIEGLGGTMLIGSFRQTSRGISDVIRKHSHIDQVGSKANSFFADVRNTLNTAAVGVGLSIAGAGVVGTNGAVGVGIATTGFLTAFVASSHHRAIENRAKSMTLLRSIVRE